MGLIRKKKMNVIYSSSLNLQLGTDLEKFAALGELQGSLCARLLVLRCIVALLADRSGSIFAFLRIIVDSCSLSSLPAWWFRKYFLR